MHIRYPLFCGFSQVVSGNGWRAAVEASGRVLAEFEDGEWWFSGVNPGGFAESGSTLGEAHARLGEAFKLVLFDFASESPSFAAFEQQVVQFVNDTNPGSEAEWLAAVADVRAGKVTTKDLQKQTAESPYWVRVARLQEPSTSENKTTQGPAVAA